MKLNKILKNAFLVIVACLVLSACATSKKSTGQMQGDVYTGTDTVEYLASGVPDRVFFATNKSSLTTASRATLRKQATYLRKNKFDILLATLVQACKKCPRAQSGPGPQGPHGPPRAQYGLKLEALHNM